MHVQARSILNYPARSASRKFRAGVAQIIASVSVCRRRDMLAGKLSPTAKSSRHDFGDIQVPLLG